MYPVKTIWRSPRETARFLVEEGQEKQALVAMVVAVVCSSLLLSLWTLFLQPRLFEVLTGASASTGFFEPGGLPRLVVSLVMAFVALPVLAWLLFRLFPILLHRFGLWFGGRATERELRIVIGWASLWFVAMNVLGAAVAGFFAQFGQASMGSGVSAVPLSPLVGFLLSLLIFFVGCVVVTHMLAVAERFSAWRSAAALGFAVILPVALIRIFHIWIMAIIFRLL